MSRRLVVVLFLDLVGWTGLAERVDPEPLQALMERYYEICSTAVEEHGGVVEKFIGDAIMAVFGSAASQENDALRALSAAGQIRADVGELRDLDATVPPLEVHCGIAAGEALVTRSVRAGMRVVGDVVNLAARLQSAAVAGEILVNDIAASLARSHVALIPVTPLTLKGKAEPVPAWRVTGPAVAEVADSAGPMVDRSAERARLRDIHQVVGDERRARVVAVLGPPGIGKTRLVRAAVDEFAPGLAVFGSCPSYGFGGTYVALAQVLEAVTREASPSQDLALENGRVAAVLAALRDTSRAGRATVEPGPGLEEMRWAAHELIAAAADRPLVVVWDNLESAGLTLLRLIGELFESLRDVPLLMICVARPELTGRDVGWIRGLGDHDVIDVGPLAPADSAVLASALSAAADPAEVLAHAVELADRVAVYSAGNPLFIRLMLESAPSDGAVQRVPPTITAMVGAMIDRLPEHMQELLVAASVVGSTFTVEQLVLLGVPVPAAALDELVQRRLIQPLADAGGYGFVQQPVHEVAYGRLEKQRRLAWHRRLAEHDVSPAFHFEASARLLHDLRPQDQELPQLSRHAAAALLHEGTAALRHRDLPAAVGLLDRAVRLPCAPQQDRSLAAIRLSDALLLAGDLRRATAVITATTAGAGQGPPLPCVVQRHLLAAREARIPEATVAALLAELHDRRDERLAWCRFEQLRMLLHLDDGRFGAAERAAGAALGHARAIGDVYEQDRLLAALCEIRQWSPTPIPARLTGCRELARRFAADRFLLVPVLSAQARCLALIGDHAGAQAMLAEAGEAAEQLGLTVGRILIDQAAALTSSLHGDHVAAERHHRWAAAALERAGYAPVALTSRVQAARERARQDLSPGAQQEITALLTRRAEMDVRGRVLCLAAAVRLDGALLPSLLGEITMLLQRTDDPCLRGEAYADVAHAHRRRGDHAAAGAMAGAAVACYTAIGATQPLRSVAAWR